MIVNGLLHRILGLIFHKIIFAFLWGGLYVGSPFLEGKLRPVGQYIISPYFNYPGNDPTSWNNTYFGNGPHAGEKEDFPNTSYVHIHKTTHETYSDSITVIQYFYFYPYNHWWNKHEGDWQKINVVLSSSDHSSATVLGVEYFFHGAHLSYYKGYGSEPDITKNFVFNPREQIKLSQGTHPIVYVGAGSHAAYPTGGRWRIFDYSVVDRWESMSHTGLVLRTQIDDSNPSLQENYDLVLLPEPDTSRVNMGLPDTMSWLGRCEG